MSCEERADTVVQVLDQVPTLLAVSQSSRHSPCSSRRMLSGLTSLGRQRVTRKLAGTHAIPTLTSLTARGSPDAPPEAEAGRHDLVFRKNPNIGPGVRYGEHPPHYSEGTEATQKPTTGKPPATHVLSHGDQRASRTAQKCMYS